MAKHRWWIFAPLLISAALLLMAPDWPGEPPPTRTQAGAGAAAGFTATLGFKNGTATITAAAAALVTDKTLTAQDYTDSVITPCDAGSCGANVAGFEYDSAFDSPVDLFVTTTVSWSDDAGASQTYLRYFTGTCGAEAGLGAAFIQDLTTTAADVAGGLTFSQIIYGLADGNCVVLASEDAAAAGFVTNADVIIRMNVMQLVDPQPVLCIVTGNKDVTAGWDTQCDGGSWRQFEDLQGTPTFGHVVQHGGIITNCGAAGSATLTWPDMPTNLLTGPESYSGVTITLLNCNGNTFALDPPAGREFNDYGVGDKITSSAIGDSATIIWPQDWDTLPAIVSSGGFTDGGP